MHDKVLKLSGLFFKLAQADTELEGPNVRIEPMEGVVQKAVERMKQTDPQYFKGVRSIVVTPGSAYGFVESGPGKDPAVIHINLDKIKGDVSQSGDNSEEAIIQAIISTIAHEKGHISSFTPEQGFVGGENPAEQEQQQFLSRMPH